MLTLHNVPDIHQRPRGPSTHSRHERVARRLQIESCWSGSRVFRKAERKVPSELACSMVAAGPENELRARVDLQQARGDEVRFVHFGDLLMVEAVGRVLALIVMREKLGGGKRVICLLPQSAVRDVVLAGERVYQRAIDPRDVEVVADNVEDSAWMVWLFCKDML